MCAFCVVVSARASVLFVLGCVWFGWVVGVCVLFVVCVCLVVGLFVCWFGLFRSLFGMCV